VVVESPGSAGEAVCKVQCEVLCKEGGRCGRVVEVWVGVCRVCRVRVKRRRQAQRAVSVRARVQRPGLRAVVAVRGKENPEERRQEARSEQARLQDDDRAGQCAAAGKRCAVEVVCMVPGVSMQGMEIVEVEEGGGWVLGVCRCGGLW